MTLTKPPPKRRRLNLKLQRQPPKDNKSPLIEVPAEIRARIFEFLFQGTTLSVTFCDDFDSDDPRCINYSASDATRRRCGIICSCKALKAEAMPILSRTALFKLDMYALLTPQIETFWDTHFSLLQHLKVMDLESIADFDSTLFPNLKYIYWDGCDVNWEAWGWPYDLDDTLSTDDLDELIDAVTGDGAAKASKTWMEKLEALFSGRDEELRNESQDRRLKLLLQLSKAKSSTVHLIVRIKIQIELFHEVFDRSGYGMTVMLVSSLF
jgi:hypothetical protein